MTALAPLHRRIVSVELKISRVAEALHQAVSNLTLATESYVGLPMSLAISITSSRRVQEFRDAGVGLLGVERAACRVLVPPRATNIGDPIAQLTCSESMLRHYLQATKH
jgi:hypothetical protein